MYLGKRLCTRLCILYIYTYIHFYINLSIYIYIAFYVCVLGSVSVFELSKGQSVAYICEKILSIISITALYLKVLNIVTISEHDLKAF